jgi:hypothetical protein
MRLQSSYGKPKPIWRPCRNRRLVRCFGSGAVTLPTEFKTRGFTGDEITVAHVNQLTGGPIMEGETARGNEEAIDKGYFTMRLGYNRKPIEVPGNDTMDQQRTKVLFQDVGREALTDYCVQLLDFSTFNQLAGYTATSFTGGRLHLLRQ